MLGQETDEIANKQIDTPEPVLEASVGVKKDSTLVCGIPECLLAAKNTILMQ